MAKEPVSPEYRRALDERKAQEKQYARTQKRFYRQKAALRTSTGFLAVSAFLAILAVGLVVFTGANSDNEGMLQWVFNIFVYGTGLVSIIGIGVGIVALIMAVDEKAPGKDKALSVLVMLGCAVIAALFFFGSDIIVTLGMELHKFIS